MRKYINIALACLCILFVLCGFTTTALAESEQIMCGDIFRIGSRIYLRTEWAKEDGSKLIYSLDYTAETVKDIFTCFYVDEKNMLQCGSSNNSYGTYYTYDSNGTVVFSQQQGLGVGTFHIPSYYANSNVDAVWGYSLVSFTTNIPIFSCKADCDAYLSGEATKYYDALNYKKVDSGGSWVKPFENIVINDSDMSSPQLSNVSHNGFTVTNVPNEKYMVDVYLESGIQNPFSYELGLTSTGDALYVNNFGLVSDIEGAYTGTIDIAKCYGVDNVSALLTSVKNFYSNYPSLAEFNKNSQTIDGLGINAKTYNIWGAPFGKSFVFFGKNTTCSSSDISALNVANCPLAYTNYKVRYYYYDESSGFHYGPWTNFIYFSDARVMSGEVYQGNDNTIIETPLISGTQDSGGNINYSSTTNFVDLNNPNEFFGYIRSLFNNVSATMSTYSNFFAIFFSFIPSDLQGVIWLGIAIMCLTGVISMITRIG